jgi:2-methylcitrate dehydratase
LSVISIIYNAGTRCRQKWQSGSYSVQFFDKLGMKKELQNLQIADFILSVEPEQIGKEITDQLKRHLLDSLGSMFLAMDKPPIQKLVQQLKILGEGGKCRVPVLGSLACDRAAQLYTALIRYPDFMDNYMGKEATCHPSDNIGVLLSAAQLNNTSGKDFLTAMAIAYQIQCRLVEEIPVMKEGIDHTLLLSYSLVSGISKILGLEREQIAHALSIAGCTIAPMVTSRASYTYEWKGLASSMDALDCMNIVLLAQQGMTGPIALFEGPKGFQEVFDMKLDYDWKNETFELISKCVLKRYNAEVHSQSAVDAALELKKEHNLVASDIAKVDVTTFITAYHIIGSGAYGDRKIVRSKEQADHSLHYVIAVALLDGEIYPEQFAPDRILKQDVQDLLQKVNVNTKFPLHKPPVVAGMLDPYTQAYPDKMKTKVEITLNNGKSFTQEQDDYPGFFTRPFTWQQTIDKFRRLSAPAVNNDRLNKIIEVVSNLEDQKINSLIDLIVA